MPDFPFSFSEFPRAEKKKRAGEGAAALAAPPRVFSALIRPLQSD